MSKTAIEYGEQTWNWFPGCNGPDGIPCAYCWSRNRILPRMKCQQCRSLIPHLHPERMGEPLFLRKPTRFLTCFTGDWMNAPGDVVRQAIGIMETCRRHTFLTLTKRPHRLADFSPFPDNAYIGISVTDQIQYDKALYYLHNIDCEVRYISFEPLLDSVQANASDFQHTIAHRIKWAIIGGVTRCPGLPQPKLEWVEEIVRACDEAGVKVWLKNSLFNMVMGRPWAFRNGNLRQEMPK